MFAPIKPTKSTIIRTVAMVGLAALTQWLMGDVGILSSGDRQNQLASEESKIAKTEDAPLVSSESKAIDLEAPLELSVESLTQDKSHFKTNRHYRASSSLKRRKSGKASPVAIWKDVQEIRFKWSKGLGKGLRNSPQKSSQFTKILTKKSSSSKIKTVWRSGFLDGKKIQAFNPDQLLPSVQALLDRVDSHYGQMDGTLFISAPKKTSSPSYTWDFSSRPSHKITEYAPNRVTGYVGELTENTKVSWLNPERGANKRSSEELKQESKTTQDEPSSVTSGAVASATNTSKGSQKLLDMLFATPDAPGSIAIGAAEGTRTTRGETTEIYWGHPDPANGVRNLGTFSYQHGASNAREADWIQLKRLRGQVEQLQNEADEMGVKLSPLELVAGADLANQSPVAALDYVDRLKEFRAQGLRGMEAVLEARIQSFVNPETGVLEAGGFGNSWDILRHDQSRRMVELQRALRVQGIH
ncbi:MAG: hypothetical protein F6J93_24865 [Oscillatoria sp. SIO1A7]|nr:hypothetical protein [Oscillatoria sp. SIO1A7]